MAPRKLNQKKVKKACKAMKAYDISEEKVISTLKSLLETFENNWIFIEQENYRVLIDAVFDSESPKTTDPVNDDLKLLRYESEEEEEDEEPLLKRPRLRRQIVSSTLADTCVQCPSNYKSGTQQLVETHTETVHIVKEEHECEEMFPVAPFQNPVIQPASPKPLTENEGNKLLALEYNDIDKKKIENENLDVSPCSCAIDAATLSIGEVNLTFKISQPPQGFHIPNMNAVVNQVENMYREKFQLIGTEISIFGILKDLSKCFVEQGNGNSQSQSIVPIVDNLKESEKSNSVEVSRSHYSVADFEQSVNMITQLMNRSSNPNNWIVYQRRKMKGQDQVS